ncbi:polysaccharide biosynthesis/export family protein [Paludisphaera mucosa]|uniref:Polysaccharide biosynthesis/export family protein n=1 Tax=Paludisphaera mucosa TaxID=3030827 RepID=A0ABT6F606_9BACT|nr:polysaccharide biosynthesis/export family protein [Paludisphaera mucosa]MDG3003005.1 polysaccharide biosynthesis/export family protein [Paludisphaera mucosa]
MTARTPTAFSCLRRMLILAGLASALLTFTPGCAGRRLRKEADQVPYRGVVDVDQARELDKTTMPKYVVEPPDELDIAVKPTPPDWSPSSTVVQADGVIDLGLYGDVYVVGLTLDQVEEKVAQQLTLDALKRGQKPTEPYRVSARLSNSQSKFFYVLGTVATEGKFPIRGNETALDAIVQAGLKSNSLPEKAYLVRPHPAGGCDQVLRIDYEAIKERGDTITNYQIFPGDRIVVPGTRPPSLIATLLGR